MKHTHTDSLLSEILPDITVKCTYLMVLIETYTMCPGTPATPATPANIVQGLPDWASQITNTDTVAAVAQILQSPQGQQVSEHDHPALQLKKYLIGDLEL